LGRLSAHLRVQTVCWRAMKNTDPRIDAYIENAPDFAQPIMTKVRKLFHRAYPDIGETIKWGNPTFEHKGIVGGFGAFKKHVAFGFWKAQAMADPENLFEGNVKASPVTIKWTSVKELPTDKVLVAYIKQAVKLNEDGVKAVKKKTARKPAPKAPPELMAALKKNKRALKTFEGFSPSAKREYCEWVSDAKREATRDKRIVQAVEWMAEGKPRNWKYMKKFGGNC
jgi:uncharacterized protein YdeI (YjbR/CyaY-like superfamily)